MSRTFRARASNKRHTRQSFIRSRVEQALLQAHRAGFIQVRIPEQERRRLRDARWDAYVTAWNAWAQTGEGDAPYRPWAVPRYRRVPLEDADMAHYAQAKAEQAAAFWDKGTRDGGPARTTNWDSCGLKSRKAQRRHARQACQALVKNPDDWDDRTWQTINGQAETFPNLW